MNGVERLGERLWSVTRAEGVGEQVEEEPAAMDWNQTVEERECPAKGFSVALGEVGDTGGLKRVRTRSNFSLSGTTVGRIGRM